MANPKITTSLFNFKTFRSPDRIDEISKFDYLILHPDFSASAFNACPLPPPILEGVDEDLVTFFEGFEPATSYKQLSEAYPEIYLFSCFLMVYIKHNKIPANYYEIFSTVMDYTEEEPLTFEEIVEYFSHQLSENEIEFDHIAVWDELFIQTATQKSTSARQACIQMIIAHYYLHGYQRFSLSTLSKMTVVIPQEVIQCFKRWRYASCGGELFGVQNLGIEEYRRVEQTLCCYVPGEVSHIENIMAREYKEKSTRNLLRTEYSSEFSSETEIENLSDTSTTERNELSKEIAKELQKDRSLDVSGSVTVNQTWGTGNMTANANTGFNSSNSSSLSDREAKNYAKEITERALERVVQKTSEKRTYKMIKEFEENNKHGFDNREGDKHVTGVYRWVDKIYDNQLVNYGRKLLFEISVPNPAAFYKKAMEWKKKKEETEVNTPIEPSALSSFDINSWSDISIENKEQLDAASAYYGINIIYPVTVKNVQFNLNHSDLKFRNQTQSTPSHSQIIEEGFECLSINGQFYVNYKGNMLNKVVSFFHYDNEMTGEEEYYCSGLGDCDKLIPVSKIFDNPISGSLNCYYRHQNVGSLSGSFMLQLSISSERLNEWQTEVFNQLQQAYQKKLDLYNEELRLQQINDLSDNEGNADSTNPAMNRLIEQRELKRLCVEMMSKPYCHDMGKNFTTCHTHECISECGEIENQVTQVTQNRELEKYAEFVQFFETAFHWEIFSYVLYPYYYNPKCQWSELLQTKSDDPIFEAFLQSGMAKVLVPVRPQYEKAVMWYMETGEIYTGENIIPDTEDDRYASLLKELDMPKPITVEETWQTRVPSSLTLIQEKSTYLKDEDGFPCCDNDDPEAEPVKFIGSEDILLERLNTSASPEPEPEPEPEPTPEP